jgi:xylitol oxidase
MRSEQPRVERRNWAGNRVFAAQRLQTPAGAGALRELVQQASGLRVLGSGHSFNALADCPGGEQVSLGGLDEQRAQGASWSVDSATGTVTVPAWATYAEVARVLAPHGLALHNLASLPHISVAGATQTGTHGSGTANGNLATAVTALEMVLANGSTVSVSRATHGEAFAGMVVGLGALGIVTRLTLTTQPAFQVRQQVFEHLSFATLTAKLSDIFASAYSVSAFTNWHSGEAAQVWLKQRDTAADAAAGSGPRAEFSRAEFFGATAAQEALHPLPGHSAVHCTGQMNEPGPWSERLPHFRSDFTPSSGAELQTEYFVALKDGPAAIAAVARLGERIAPLLFVSELRTIAADDLWLSPCYGRTSLALHFTWQSREAEVMALLPEVEAALAPFDARPHWAKLFAMPAERLTRLYPRMEQFRSFREKLDPSGKFRNEFLIGLAI